MTFIKVLERLEAYGSVSVRPELSPGEQKAVALSTVGPILWIVCEKLKKEKAHEKGIL